MSSRRLRKKRHWGEYNQQGFTAMFKFVLPTTDADVVDLTDGFIGCIEGLGCICSGFSGPERSWYEIYKEYGDVTESERQKLIDWLSADDRVNDVQATGLHKEW